MARNIRVLDCTLRDGAYITNSQFGEAAIRGIIKKMQEARIEVIEIGWLKNDAHKEGSTFFHLPKDAQSYISNKDPNVLYTAMIDWDRYDTDQLPMYDGKSIDAIRVVFPHGRHQEGIKVGKDIRKKGYKVLFQAANTLAYSDEDLDDLTECINNFKPVSLSIVDTFGAMFFDELEHIASYVDSKLLDEIGMGFHAHNNQQLAFALCIRFVEIMSQSNREIMVDSSLSGMGRGAGNATTELITSYLNRKQHGNYDLNAVMDAIDIYMQGYQERYTWGYSTPYFIAGMYQCHVNNIAYLTKNHRVSAKDMRSIIESLSLEDRRKYDYDLLEEKYLENQNRIVDDESALNELRDMTSDKKVLLIAPGKSVDINKADVKRFIDNNNPITIAVNALNPNYSYDYAIFINQGRYEYAKSYRPEKFESTRKILLSNISTNPGNNEIVINYDTVVKRGWEHFDNAVITCLRLMDFLAVKDVYIAGFDGFKNKYNESYSDENLPTLNPDNRWDELNEEIKDMYKDFYYSKRGTMDITFLTDSIYEIKEKQEN